MKTKKVERGFWVNSDWLKDFQRDDFGHGQPYIYSKQTYPENVKITISWEEAEEQYLVTMKEMSSAFFDWYSKGGVPAHFNEFVADRLKLNIFKDK